MQTIRQATWWQLALQLAAVFLVLLATSPVRAQRKCSRRSANSAWSASCS